MRRHVVERRGRGRDGLVDLVGRRRAHGAEQLARGRAAHLDLLAVAGQPLAADEGTALRHHLSHSDLLRHDSGDNPPRRPRLERRRPRRPVPRPLRVRWHATAMPRLNIAVRPSSSTTPTTPRASAPGCSASAAARRQGDRRERLRAAARPGDLPLPLRVRRGGVAARARRHARRCGRPRARRRSARGDGLLPVRARRARIRCATTTDATVRVLMFSTRKEFAVAVYPDSDKIGDLHGRQGATTSWFASRATCTTSTVRSRLGPRPDAAA